MKAVVDTEWIDGNPVAKTSLEWIVLRHIGRRLVEAMCQREEVSYYVSKPYF